MLRGALGALQACASVISLKGWQRRPLNHWWRTAPSKSSFPSILASHVNGQSASSGQREPSHKQMQLLAAGSPAGILRKG